MTSKAFCTATPQTDMLRILIADDHEIVRRGIRQLLSEGLPFPHIAEVQDTTSLIETALNEHWDLIISDLSMPGGGGLHAIRVIREKKPFQSILVISIYPEEQYAVKVLSLGASGYLNKDAATEELMTAVKTVLSGKCFIQDVVAEKISDTLRRQAGLLPHELLSEREFTVLLKLVKGLSITEIAAELAISANTVSTYRARVLAKMDVKTNADLITYAIINGLV